MSRTRGIRLNPTRLEDRLMPAFGDLLQTLNNPSPNRNDAFGEAIAIDGDLAVIGAFQDDSGGGDSGQAYVFNIGTGALVATLKNPTPAGGDQFGFSVDISGTRVVVGMPVGGPGPVSIGEVHVYNVAGASGGVVAPFVTIGRPATVPGDPFDNFGCAVAINGTRVVVGMAGQTGDTNAGTDPTETAYVYDIATASPTLVATLNNPDPTINDNFGTAVDIDGNLVVVGADRDNPNGVADAGSAYVFDLNAGSNPPALATLNNPTPGSGDYFGGSVAVRGTRVVVGASRDDVGGSFDAGSAFVFDVAGGAPALLATLSDPSGENDTFFGDSVAVGDTRIIVGAFGNTVGTFSNAGSAFLFSAAATGSPAPLATINLTTVEPYNHLFGHAVSIGGSRVVVGAPATKTNGAFNGGTAYVFDIAPPPPVTLEAEFSTGRDSGGTASVSLYNPDKSVRFTIEPFGTAFTGGIRTAAADFNGDGVADLVAGTGPGRATRVVILDGVSKAELFGADPFEASFTGGVYVTAGDLNGDGKPDLAITPDEGGGPRVDVYSGAGFGKLASFFGIDDPSFRGGARAATGDLNGDGTADLIVVAGFGGGPRVAGFDGKTVGGTPTRLFGDFFAFEQALRNGIFVAVGDTDGDGFADLICGGGPGGGPRVTVFGGKPLLSNTYDVRANFFGGDESSRGGIRVTAKDLDADAKADIVVGAGAGAGSRVTAYLGKDIAPAGTPAAHLDYDAFPGFTGGVFVG